MSSFAPSFGSSSTSSSSSSSSLLLALPDASDCQLPLTLFFSPDLTPDDLRLFPETDDFYSNGEDETVGMGMGDGTNRLLHTPYHVMLRLVDDDSQSRTRTRRSGFGSGSASRSQSQFSLAGEENDDPMQGRGRGTFSTVGEDSGSGSDSDGDTEEAIEVIDDDDDLDSSSPSAAASGSFRGESVSERNNRRKLESIVRSARISVCLTNGFHVWVLTQSKFIEMVPPRVTPMSMSGSGSGSFGTSMGSASASGMEFVAPTATAPVTSSSVSGDSESDVVMVDDVGASDDSHALKVCIQILDALVRMQKDSRCFEYGLEWVPGKSMSDSDSAQQGEQEETNPASGVQWEDDRSRRAPTSQQPAAASIDEDPLSPTSFFGSSSVATVPDSGAEARARARRRREDRMDVDLADLSQTTVRESASLDGTEEPPTATGFPVGPNIFARRTAPKLFLNVYKPGAEIQTIAFRFELSKVAPGAFPVAEALQQFLFTPFVGVLGDFQRLRHHRKVSESEIRAAQDRHKQIAELKNLQEKELMTNFVAVLNAKKSRLRKVQQRMEALKRENHTLKAQAGRLEARLQQQAAEFEGSLINSQGSPNSPSRRKRKKKKKSAVSSPANDQQGMDVDSDDDGDGVDALFRDIE